MQTPNESVRVLYLDGREGNKFDTTQQIKLQLITESWSAIMGG